MMDAVSEIIDLAYNCFVHSDLKCAAMVEPLEEVVDDLKDTIRARHIARLQKGECTIELGFILTDLLTNLERVSDHCSNIAGCMIEMSHKDLAIHEYLRRVKDGNREEFNRLYTEYSQKYSV